MTVKRVWTALAVLLVAVAMAGCGDDDKKSASENGTTGPVAAADPGQSAATGATGGDGDGKKSEGDDSQSDAGDDDSTSDGGAGASPDGASTDSGGGDSGDKDRKSDKGDDSDELPTPTRGPTSVQFFINDGRFTGRTLADGPFKGKFGREVPPNSRIVTRLTVFDATGRKVTVKYPNGDSRTFSARKLKYLPPLSLGQSYRLKMRGTGSTAYVYAVRSPHLVGPIG